LEERLIFGNYPELLQYPSDEEKANYLRDLINSYLLKDILALDSIRNSSKIFDLLRLLAFQVGSLVSLNELSSQLSMSKNTVERYMDLLAKTFVIFRHQPYSNNLRKEISKSSKWYFYDNGIRNAIIANLNLPEFRNDMGMLWENYLASERIKQQQYTFKLVNNYFWRNYQQQEIDWIEERGGKLSAFEFKWNSKNKAKAPASWKELHPKSSYKVITTENYLDWIT
jgi:predicted AAA+ superfamily ATPase